MAIRNNAEFKVYDNLIMENVKIIFRNFAGLEGMYNRQGDRNFCVLIEDPNEALRLAGIGWNVKQLKPLDEDSVPASYIPVSVSYDNYPPAIYLVNKHGKKMLTEDKVAMLDSADIKNVDLVIRPYNWTVNGKSGVKAYVKSMYVTIEEDVFAAKYEFTTAAEDDLPF